MITKTTKSPFAYYFLNETLVDPDEHLKHFKPIQENTVEVNGEKLMTLTYNQVLQSFGVRNWNGRVYKKENTMKSLNSNPLIQYDLKMGTWTAEYGHPSIEKGQNELARQMSIDPLKACNTIDKYWEDGNLLMGQCTTLAGGWGDVLMKRCLTGYPPMASSRAIGGVDANGNVLPGYTIVTFDTVIRPSHKEAYAVKGSEHTNQFAVGGTIAPMGNTMTESVSKFDFEDKDSEAFKSFLLAESTSRESINVLCDALGLDYNTMTINESYVEIQKINESDVCTVKIPLRNLINAEYFNLF